MKNPKTLHIFGGGAFVNHAVKIARDLEWKVVLRTGERFLKDFKNYNDKGVEILVGNSLTDLMDQGREPKDKDIGISFSAPWIISKKIIDMFDGKIYNLHNQPLPKFRGGGGSSWNILMKDKQGGSSIHLLVPEIDAGQIYASVKYTFPKELIYPRDFDNYAIDQATILLHSWLPKLLKTGDSGLPIENNDEESEYWPRLNANLHGWINWSWSLEDILVFCNAFSYPHNGAKTILNEEIVHLPKVRLLKEKDKFHPFQTGLIYKVNNNEMYVSHPDGTLIIEELKFAADACKILLGDRLYTPIGTLEDALTKRIQYSPDGSVFNLKK